MLGILIWPLGACSTSVRASSTLWAASKPTMEVKSVGTFPVILLKLETPPLPPQTKLNFEQNGWEWVLFWPQHCWGKFGNDGMNPKPNKKLSLGAGFYLTIAWEGFFAQSQVLCPPLKSRENARASSEAARSGGKVDISILSRPLLSCLFSRAVHEGFRYSLRWRACSQAYVNLFKSSNHSV